MSFFSCMPKLARQILTLQLQSYAAFRCCLHKCTVFAEIRISIRILAICQRFKKHYNLCSFDNWNYECERNLCFHGLVIDCLQGCLVQVGNGIELEAVGLQFEPYRWRPCGVTWDSSRTVVEIKLRWTSALLELRCILLHFCCRPVSHSE